MVRCHWVDQHETEPILFCRCPSAVSAAVPVTIGNDFCLVRASDSAEIRAFRHSRFSMRTMTHGASAG
jgi:hypothetical protein